MTQELLLIQFSDCHISAADKVRNVDTKARLERAIKHAALKHPRHRALLISGDLSEDGSSESYQKVLQCFANYQQPIYVTPGNHDNALELRQQCKQRLQQLHSVSLGNWQLLLLDSTVKQQVYGELKRQDLIWLESWLSTQQAPTIIALHHPPVKIGNAWMDKIGLENGAELMQLLAQFSQVKAVLFGHLHHSFATWYQHIQVLGCPSTAFKFDPNSEQFRVDTSCSGYRWLKLKANGELETASCSF